MGRPAPTRSQPPPGGGAGWLWCSGGRDRRGDRRRPEDVRKNYPRTRRATKANAKVAENLYRKATGEGREAVIAAIFG